MKNVLLFLCVVLIFGCSSEEPAKPKKEKPRVNVVSDVDRVEVDSVFQNDEGVDLPVIPSLEEYFKNIPSDSELEVVTFTWPSDDLLCDWYTGSEGDLEYTIYRIKGTGQIIYVSESGAYCQGDSDYYYNYTFDLNGLALSSYEGFPFAPDVLTFYEKGKAIVQMKFPAYMDSPMDVDEKPILKHLSSDMVVNSKQFVDLLDEYKTKVVDRIESLKNYPNSGGDLSDAEIAEIQRDSVKMKERSMTLLELQKIARKDYSFSDAEVCFRLPVTADNEPGRNALQLNGLNVPVYSSPSIESEVITTLSYYDPMLYFVEVGAEETMGKYGTHAWYKVKKFYDRGQPQIEGWVFGAFVAKGIYPVIE